MAQSGTNADGLTPEQVILQQLAGVGAGGQTQDLSNYYTKGQSDVRYATQQQLNAVAGLTEGETQTLIDNSLGDYTTTSAQEIQTDIQINDALSQIKTRYIELLFDSVVSGLPTVGQPIPWQVTRQSTTPGFFLQPGDQNIQVLDDFTIQMTIIINYGEDTGQRQIIEVQPNIAGTLPILINNDNNALDQISINQNRTWVFDSAALDIINHNLVQLSGFPNPPADFIKMKLILTTLTYNGTQLLPDITNIQISNVQGLQTELNNKRSVGQNLSLVDNTKRAQYTDTFDIDPALYTNGQLMPKQAIQGMITALGGTPAAIESPDVLTQLFVSNDGSAERLTLLFNGQNILLINDTRAEILKNLQYPATVPVDGASYTNYELLPKIAIQDMINLGGGGGGGVQALIRSSDTTTELQVYDTVSPERLILTLNGTPVIQVSTARIKFNTELEYPNTVPVTGAGYTDYQLIPKIAIQDMIDTSGGGGGVDLSQPLIYTGDSNTQINAEVDDDVIISRAWFNNQINLITPSTITVQATAPGETLSLEQVKTVVHNLGQNFEDLHLDAWLTLTNAVDIYPIGTTLRVQYHDYLGSFNNIAGYMVYSSQTDPTNQFEIKLQSQFWTRTEGSAGPINIEYNDAYLSMTLTTKTPQVVTTPQSVLQTLHFNISQTGSDLFLTSSTNQSFFVDVDTMTMRDPVASELAMDFPTDQTNRGIYLYNILAQNTIKLDAINGEITAPIFTTALPSSREYKNYVSLASHYEDIFNKPFPKSILYKYKSEFREEQQLPDKPAVGYVWEELNDFDPINKFKITSSRLDNRSGKYIKQVDEIRALKCHVAWCHHHIDKLNSRLDKMQRQFDNVFEQQRNRDDSMRRHIETQESKLNQTLDSVSVQSVKVKPQQIVQKRAVLGKVVKQPAKINLR